MSICDNTTVNQEIPLKLQSIRKTKIHRNACKKTFNDPKIRRSTKYTKKVPRYFCTRYCPPLTIGQDRPINLDRLSIESEIAKQLDFDSVIRSFAEKKARKATLF